MNTTIDRSACTAKRHGTYNAYSHFHCSCPDAREDWRLYNKRRREGRATPRRFDPTGSRRRIQALMTIGHSSPTIGLACGMRRKEVVDIANKPAAYLNSGTVAAIRRAYDQLSTTPGASIKTRNYAARHGWAPPLAWDDDTIDDPDATPDLGAPIDDGVDAILVYRALRGEAAWGDLNRAERAAVARARGTRTLSELARLTRASYSAVQRPAPQHNSGETHENVPALPATPPRRGLAARRRLSAGGPGDLLLDRPA